MFTNSKTKKIMKLKKTFSFTDKNQIWRLLISETDKLLIETRDLEKKEVFFHCYDLLKENYIQEFSVGRKILDWN